MHKSPSLLLPGGVNVLNVAMGEVLRPRQKLKGESSLTESAPKVNAILKAVT